MSAFWYFACARIAYSEHFESLLKRFKSVDELWENITPLLWCADRRYELSWQRIVDVKKNLVYWQHLYESTVAQGVMIIAFDDRLYPLLLKQIYAPPLVLFVKGNESLLAHDQKVSIVGTRRSTDYGESITRKITQSLLSCNLVPVSGLAYGIDSTVHCASLHADQSSIAVVPAALTDDVWGGNSYLRPRLSLEKHLFLSETLPQEKLTKFHFVKRNRLIAGLSKWLIVTEAPVKSGALITAKYALEAGREIFVVPHNLLNELGTGGLRLANEGATLITSLEELPSLFSLKSIATAKALRFNSLSEEGVYNKIVTGASLEEIALSLAMTKEELLTTIGSLLVRGYLRMNPDGSYLAE